MAIPTSSKAVALGFFLAASILPSGGGSIAHAQDAVGNLPPELRDFRLDPPPSEAEPAPQVPGPEVRSPPQAPPTKQAPVVPPENVIPAPVIQRPVPTVAEPLRVDPPPSGESVQDTSAQSKVAPSINAEPSPLNDAEPAIAPTQPEPTPVAPTESGGISDLGLAAMAALLMAIGAAGWLLWRRRTRTASRRAPQSAPVKPQKAFEPAPAPRLVPAAPPTASKPPARSISMNFVPEKAVVSLVSLNIQGKLHVANSGGSATNELALHTVLISASHDQQREMESFFANPGHNAPMPLLAIGTGDSITIPLKIGVALTAMQAFSLNDMTLLAPILLAKLVSPSQDGSVQEVARLVCMIGREANPPQARMGPLRLDQGPRSFDHLGQRALVS